jgi:hypothetical protein
MAAAAAAAGPAGFQSILSDYKAIPWSRDNKNRNRTSLSLQTNHNRARQPVSPLLAAFAGGFNARPGGSKWLQLPNLREPLPRCSISRGLIAGLASTR